MTSKQKDGRVGVAFALLIITAAMGDGLALAALFPAMPAISRHFADVQHVDTLVRGLATIVNLAMVIGSPMAGYLVERVGTRKVLLTAATLFTISGVAGFFIDNLALLLASRAIMGLSQVTVSTTVLALIAMRVDPVRRNFWIGLFTFFGAISSMMWVQLSGLAAEQSWRLVFLFHLTGVATLACAAVALRTGFERSPVPAHGDGIPGASKAGLWALLPLVVIAIAAGSIENTTPLFLPFHLVEIGETSSARIAQTVWPITLGVAISAFGYGWLRRYLSINMTFIVAFLSSGVILICLGLAQTFTAVMIATSCLGLAIGFLAPNVFTYAAEYGEEGHRARNIGIARGTFFIGGPAAQLLLEPISNSASNGMALVALGCLSLMFMLWRLAEARRRA